MPPGQETIREQILQDVETALQLPDGGSGYFYSLSTNNVFRADDSALDAENGPYPLLAVAALDSANTGGSNADSDTYMGEALDIEIHALLADSSSNAQRDLSRIEHDIRMALRQDKSRGGLAFSTEWQRTETFLPTNVPGHPVAIVSFQITYEVNESDLTTLP